MAASLGIASLLIKLDLGEYQRQLTKFKTDSQGAFRAIADSAKATGQSIKQSFQDAIGPSDRLRTAVLGLSAGMVAFGVKAVKAAGDFEQARIAYETMLGSAEAAQSLLAEMQTFAAKTPFGMTQLTEAGKLMLAFGFQAKEILPNLQMLGDVAAGLSIPVDDLAMAFGRARTTGRLMSDSLRTLLRSGVPVLDVLAERFNTTKQGVMDLVGQGKVSFEDLRAVFVSLTQEGGRFHNLMQKQSESTLGIWSNLMDAIEATVIDLGDAFVEAFDIKGLLQTAVAWVERLGAVVKERGIINILEEYKGVISGIAAAVGGALVPSLLNTAIALARSGARLAPWAAAGYLVWRVASDLGVKFEDVIPIVGRFGAVIGGIVSIASGAATSISALVRAVIQSIGDWGRYLDMIWPQLQSIQAYLQAGMFGEATRAVQNLPSVMRTASRVAFRGLADDILDDFDKANAAITGGWDMVWGGITGNLGASAQNVASAVSGALTDGITEAQGIINSFTFDLDGLTDGLLGVGGAAGDAADKVTTLADALAAAQAGTQAYANRQALEVQFGQKSPTLAMANLAEQSRELGRQIEELVAKGISAFTPEDFQRLANLMNRREFVDGVFDQLKENVTTEIREAIQGGLEAGVAWIQTGLSWLAKNVPKATNLSTEGVSAVVLDTPVVPNYVPGTQPWLRQQASQQQAMNELVAQNARNQAAMRRITLDTQVAMAGGWGPYLKGLAESAAGWLKNSEAVQSFTAFGRGAVTVIGNVLTAGRRAAAAAAENAAQVLADTRQQLAQLSAAGRLLGPSFDASGQAVSLVESALRQLAGTVPDSNESLRELVKLLADTRANAMAASRALPSEQDLAGLRSLVDLYRTAPALLTNSDWERLMVAGVGMGPPGGAKATSAEQARDVREAVEKELAQLATVGGLLGESFNEAGRGVSAIEAAITTLAGVVDATNPDMMLLLSLLERYRLLADEGSGGMGNIADLQKAAEKMASGGASSLTQDEMSLLMGSGIAMGFPDGVKQWAASMEDATDDIGEKMNGLLASSAMQFGSDLGKLLAGGSGQDFGQSLISNLTGLGSGLAGLIGGPWGMLASFGVNLLGGLFGGLLGGGGTSGRELSETGNTLARSANTPAIEYNAIAEITLSSGFSVEDPRTLAVIRDTAREVSLDLLRNLELI